MLRRMRIAAGIVIALGFLAALVAVTLQETGVSCEACVDFNGRSQCSRASGPDREHAIAQARSTACALMTSGVTEVMGCNRTPSRLERCEGD